MKKLYSMIIALICSFMLLSTAAVADDGITVLLDGQSVEFDVPPAILNDRTMVPMRAVFEALGASVEWDDATKTASAKKDNVNLLIIPNSNVMTKNSLPISLDVGPVIIDGRILVPVRAIAESFGCDVSWEADTRSVVIRTESYQLREMVSEQVEIVSVSTADELMNAIGSNKIIHLTAPSYNLSDAVNVNNENLTVNKYTGAYTIKDVINLTITGNAEILINDIYSAVLHFENCYKITLDGITAGHTESFDEYACEGPVVSFFECEDVSVKNCSLFGCGAVGIDAYRVRGLTAEKCRIYDCTRTGVLVSDGTDAVIDGCEIFDSSMMDGFCCTTNSSAVFRNCIISNITCTDTFIEDMEFDDGEESLIVLENCEIRNNTFSRVIPEHGNVNMSLLFKNCVFEGNSDVMVETEYVKFENCTIK